MNEKELLNSLDVFAHKIKNPIHSVVINLDVLKVKLQKEKADRQTLKHLDIAISEVKRISEIVAKYTNYLQKGDREKRKIDLKKLLG